MFAIRKVLYLAVLSWPALVFIVADPAPGATRRRPSRQVVPSCADVRGLPGMYRSEDGGQSFSRNAAPATVIQPWGTVVFEDSSNDVVAASGQDIYDSADGGCNWTLRYTIARALHHPLHLTAASDRRAFFWSDEVFLRYDQGTVMELTAPEPVGGLGVAAGNRQHVRVFGLISGTLWESFDSGETWRRKGPGAGGVVRASAFDPSDFNHIVLATPGGVATTRDGGDSWTHSSPFPRTVCELAFVRNNPSVVWAALSVQSGSDGIYRSLDGGATFGAVARVEVTTNANGACLPFTAHPVDINVSLVPFRTVFFVDAATRTSTPSSCCPALWASRVAYSPVDPKIMFLQAVPIQ